ncbi:ankyrin PH SEC7 domain-containing protein [Fusarium heterosporum]|uniref:Ankyrin PH SEC7 domain-containing protein n=1 Tax=Fusarium heterosporum TaxID=42747 RepID=A0A8H5TQ55_FUSHE|nr:ankyrin PH SEC7 domain-containing protein [Fusarium heterosporum]
MEVLGAVASSIAVIQALAAGKHVVSLVREMPDIQKDFEYLMKELGLIRSMAQAVASIPPTAFQQDLINNASSSLEEVTNELDALLRKCAHETDQEDKTVWKTKKRKWLLQKGDINKLQQRMSQAREILHFAVTSSQISANSQLHTEVTVCVRLYSAVEVLLELWKNLLVEFGLPIRVTFRASNLLRDPELSDHQSYLLKIILSFARNQYEGGTTKVHDAIRRGEGLQEALKEQPWAIDTIDDTGHSPLLLATSKLQTLDMDLLLSAGVNVDQQIYDGTSALMLAAYLGDLEAVSMLLKAKGSVKVTDDEGSSSLSHAMCSGNEEVIRLLLTAGASATHKDIYTRTPLHYLRYSSASHDSIRYIISMLLMAGADLEAKNDFGHTPILSATMQDNLTVVRSLYAFLDTLTYLISLELSGIDPFQKVLGATPWDLFVITNTISERYRGRIRKPNFAEQEAFVELYQSVRDRWLQQDICILEQILSAFRKKDIAEARKKLASLIEKESSWEKGDLASWYKAVDKRVQHMEWELATEDVEGYLVDVRNELDTPVWMIPSAWGEFVWSDGDEGSVSGLESSESAPSAQGDLVKLEVPAVRDQDD